MAPVCVVVKVTLNDPTKGEEFAKVFSALHRHANTQEPQTLLYALHTDSSNPAILYIVERYTGAAALDDIHCQSEPFKEFLSKAPSLPYVTSLDIAKMEEVTCSALDYVQEAAAKKGVLVFCGARDGKSAEKHTSAAKSLGTAIAKRGRSLVYGGGTCGVMGNVSKSVKENGGKIISVIPSALAPREVSGDMLGTVYFTHSMSERKCIMFSLSDTVIILPGGIGTFDETLEVLTLIQLNSFRPKIGFLNANGFFDAFFTFLRHLISEGYLEEKIFDYFVVENSCDGEALLSKLEAFEVPPSIAQLKWPNKNEY